MTDDYFFFQTMPCLPHKHDCGQGVVYSTYKNGDDWGMVQMASLISTTPLLCGNYLRETMGCRICLKDLFIFWMLFNLKGMGFFTVITTKVMVWNLLDTFGCLSPFFEWWMGLAGYPCCPFPEKETKIPCHL